MTTSRRLAALLLLVAAAIAVTSSELRRTWRKSDAPVPSNGARATALAQGFRTGSNADGYYIDEVVLSFDRDYADVAEMELWDSYNNTVADAQRPNSKVFTFTGPASFVGRRQRVHRPGRFEARTEQALLRASSAQRFEWHVLGPHPTTKRD